MKAAPIAVSLPAPTAQRLLARAANAGLSDAAGRPDVAALRDRAIKTLVDAGETVADAIHALVTDERDPDLGAYVRASIAAVVGTAPPRWASHLADRLDLPVGTVKQLHLRAERQPGPTGKVPDVATMASAALTVALNGAPATDADVARFIAGHPEPAMRDLMRGLEQARAAGRPS